MRCHPLYPLASHGPIWVVLALLLAGCGGGSDGGTSGTNVPPPAAASLTGYFIDAPVAGAGYRTATLSGLTGADGGFGYADGETVELSVGPVRLGAAAAATYVSPLDLIPAAAGITDARVAALASFLQSADADADLGNGIQVSATLAERLCGELNVASLDFTTLTDTAAFDAALQTAVAAEGLGYVGPAAAAAHLGASLMALMEATAAYNPSWGTAGVFTGAARCAQCHEARAGEAALRLPRVTSMARTSVPIRNGSTA